MIDCRKLVSGISCWSCFHNFSTSSILVLHSDSLKILFIFIITVSGLRHKRQLLGKTVLRNNSVSIFTEDQRHSFCRRDYKLLLRLTPRIVTLKHFTYTRDVFSISSRSHGFSKLQVFLGFCPGTIFFFNLHSSSACLYPCQLSILFFLKS